MKKVLPGDTVYDGADYAHHKGCDWCPLEVASANLRNIQVVVPTLLAFT